MTDARQKALEAISDEEGEVCRCGHFRIESDVEHTIRTALEAPEFTDEEFRAILDQSNLPTRVAVKIDTYLKSKRVFKTL